MTLKDITKNLGDYFNKATERVKTLPDQIRATRQLVEQQTPRINNTVQNVVNRIPQGAFQGVIPGFTPQLSKQTIKIAAPMVIEQPGSYLRGAEYLTNSKRRQEVSQMDLMGKFNAAGDVLNFVPFGTAAKYAPKGVKALSGAQALLGQAGKVKLGPEVKTAAGKLPAKLLKSSQEFQETIGKVKLSGTSGKIVPQVKNPTDPFFNVNRLNVTPEVKQTLKNVVEETKPRIEQVVGKKLSNNEVIGIAANSAKTFKKAVTRDQTAAWEAALLKSRQLLADQASTGTVTKEYLDNLVTIKSLGTDIARKLQSFSIGADPQSITAKEAILEAVLKQNQNTEEILQAAKGVDFNDVNQATNFYRQFIEPKASEWIDLIRYNSMLSSPNTHIANISSNFQGTGIVAPIEKTVTGAIDFLKSTVTGQPRKYLIGEGAHYAKGYYSSLGNAAHAFADVLRGKAISGNPDMRQLPLSTGGAARGIENVLSVPMKALEAADQFFQELTKGGSRAALQYKVSQGIKVPDMELKALQEARQRLFRADLTPEGQGHLLNGLDQVTGVLFTLRSSNNPIVSTIAKFSIPFLKTPMNILKQGIEYSPLGITTIPGTQEKLPQITKALMGTAIGLGTASLIGSNRLSWAEPTNAKQKEAFRGAGMQPYSVKIGDKWVSYSKLHPAISFNLALVAAVDDALKNKRLNDSEAETVLTGLSKWVQFFADQSYMKNIGDFMASAKGDLEGPARYLSNYPQQLIPFRALMGWVTRLVDPYQRKVDPDGSILEKQLMQLATQIPGLSESVPARTDTQGNPIPQSNPLVNAFSPNRVTTENLEGKQIYDKMIEESNQRKLINDLKSSLASDQEISGPAENPAGLSKESSFNIKGADVPGYIVGDKFVYVDANGTTKTASIDVLKQNQISYQKTIADAQYSLDAQKYKRMDDLDSWMQVTTAHIQALQDYQQALDPVADKAKITRAQNTIDDLQSTSVKYQEYKGFTKPKKTKTLKGRKAAKISIKTSRAAKVFTYKSPRAAKPKLKLAKIPVFKVTKAKTLKPYKAPKTRSSFMSA